MKRILIVDDETENRYMLRSLLEGRGHEVVEAFNGAEALEKARQAPPDLVIADVLMPVMDGFTLCRNWRADPALKSIPFIFHTAASDDSKDEAFAMGLGADHFVRKPMEPESLALIIDEALALEPGAVRKPDDLAPREPDQIMRQYNEVLVRGLEHKVGELEAIRARLQEEVEQRRRSEQALGFERNLMQALMATIPASVYFKDLDSKFIMVSDAKARRHNMAPADLAGKSDFDLFSEKHARQAFEDEQRIIKTGEGMVDVEERVTWHYRPDTWVRSTKMPLKDSTGRIIGTFGLSFDITARKQAEARTRQQAALLDNAADAMYVRFLDGGITYWNNAAEKLYGWTRAEVLGQTLQELSILEVEDHVDDLEDLLMREGMWAGEQRQITRDGREITVFSRLTLMRDDAGRPSSVFAINSDITALQRPAAKPAGQKA